MCFYTYLVYNLIFYKYSSTITIKYKLHLPIYHPNNSQNTLYKANQNSKVSHSLKKQWT